ncbi:MAG: DUF1145 domain-containing protein [Burkholderiaceae bacterium]|nr:DUF1145 domain-containing protein [Burkholderiaceae bacterium]
MNAASKAFCLVLYAVALASLVISLPAVIATPARILAALFVVAHILEAVVFLRHLRLYKGPLAVSVLLTLLFGLFHWKPLADAAAGKN